MAYSYRMVRWLDVLAFISLALGVLGLVFSWMPRTGVVLSAVGLGAGFLGWLAAVRHGTAPGFYLLTGSVVSLAGLVLNVLVLNGTLARWL